MAIGVTYKAIRLTVSLVLEEATLKSWRGINFENTAKEYKRWSEISPEQLWLGFRDGLVSDDLLIFYDIGIVIVIRWWEERIRKTRLSLCLIKILSERLQLFCCRMCGSVTFIRWKGWAVSKVLCEWISNVGSIAREGAKAMSLAFVLLDF